MSEIKIDALAVKQAFLSAVVALDANKEWINELNVFPVPDGDTGTNMTLTVMSAADDVAGLNNPDMETVCRTISNGTLRGARGNSGVITSQLIRGLMKSFATEINVDAKELAYAFGKAVDTAYKAVMKPKEGTILTVARAMSEKALLLSKETDDIELLLRETIKAGQETLERTPEMLPVLKQAGVVDAGGQGLMVLFSAAADSFMGKSLVYNGASGNNGPASKVNVNRENLDTNDIKFGYCTEFIIKNGISEEQEKEFKAFLESVGDSIVCVAAEDFVKIHVHTNDPGKVFSKALTYGELSRMKIDNMREEHRELYREFADAEKKANDYEPSVNAETSEPDEKISDGIKASGAIGPEKLSQEKPKERKPYAVISVSVGKGLSEIFKGLGADYIIEGGQTMNPSTDDIVKAIESVNADVVYVLPNNKNIIMAARQAASIVSASGDVITIVIPSKSIPLGITALMCLDPDAEPEDNEINMTESLETVKYCEVTNAVRDTNIDGFEIKNGDMMAIGDSGMLAVESTPEKAAVEGIRSLIDEYTELVTIYFGENTTEEDAVAVSDALETEYPEVEFDVEHGGQPVYNYFISVE